MKYTIAVLALITLNSQTKAHKITSNNNLAVKSDTKDWGSLLDADSSFADHSYETDTPEEYSDLVSEVVKERETAVKTRKAKAKEVAKAKRRAAR